MKKGSDAAAKDKKVVKGKVGFGGEEDNNSAGEAPKEKSSGLRFLGDVMPSFLGGTKRGSSADVAGSISPGSSGSSIAGDIATNSTHPPKSALKHTDGKEPKERERRRTVNLVGLLGKENSTKDSSEDDTRKWKAKADQWKERHAKTFETNPEGSPPSASPSATPVSSNTSVSTMLAGQPGSYGGSHLSNSSTSAGSSSASSSQITAPGKMKHHRAHPAGADLSVSHLVVAFEDCFIKNPRSELGELTQRDWNELFRLQTMRKTNKSRAMPSLMGLFASNSNDDDEDDEDEVKNKIVDLDALQADEVRKQKENWQNLDEARKRRRIQQFLNRRISVKERLELEVLQHIVLARPQDDSQSYKADENYPPLIVCPCEGHKLEMGTIVDTSLESQLKYITLLDADKATAHYQEYFFEREHHNFLGSDDKGGWAVISIQAEGRGEEKQRANSRVLVRTKEGAEVMFVEVAADAKEMLGKVLTQAAYLAAYKYKKIKDAALPKALLGLEKSYLNKRSKFGIVYVKQGQKTENELFSNVEMSSDFVEFIDFIGSRVALEGWTKYSGGLDVARNSTGKESVYTEHRGVEIMFHVAPLLPFFPSDPQQLERKRHIGNDIGAIVFLEETPFDPKLFVSEFLHIFAFVAVDKKKKSETGVTHYRLAFATRSDIDLELPLIPHPPSFPKGEPFRDFLLTKMLNAERSALRASVFEAKMIRTRKQLLADIGTDFQNKS